AAGHDHESEHSHGALAWGAAALLGLLTVWVLLRQGPRAFLGQLGGGQGHSHGPQAGHGHTHGHSHGHDGHDGHDHGPHEHGPLG
ncbi:MAG: hypothetical protein HUU28_13615, partial [Planctomycetaceae bacterium]|nr:hypothetical protein [Planctomycetaceae bacterium]